MLPAKIRRYLDEQGIEHRVHRHPRAVSAQKTAAAQRVSGWRVAKSVVVFVDDEPLICVVPAPDLVDFDRLSDALGGVRKELRLANEQEIEALFPGCELGAAPPLGKLFAMRTICDRSLLRCETIFLRGGSHELLVELSPLDYQRIEEPLAVRLGWLPGESWSHAMAPTMPERHAWYEG